MHLMTNCNTSAPTSNSFGRFFNSFFLIQQAIIAASYLLIVCTSSQALKIEITQGQVTPTPIAVTDFISTTGDTIGVDMANVVRNDLEHSGLFAVINKAAYLQDTISLQGGPRFQDWRVINAQCLVSGSVSHDASGQLVIEFRLFDVMGGTQMLGLSLKADPKRWRKLAHMVSDAIYKRITGEEGYFDTMISYIEESGPKGKGRVRRLAIMDWDGHNNIYLTDGKNLVLTPRFSPNNRDIAYLSFQNKTAHVYIFNLHTRQKRLLGQFEGMTFAPRFSNDGSTIVYSLARNGTTALYSMNLQTRQVTQLTNHVCIDTSPCFSPDGSKIVFTSDRANNKEQIYVMDANGQNVHRISSGEGTYSQPTWSPRGDLIAFTKKVGGQFYIGVMRPDGSDERLIADGYLVEAATWAPNGRVLLFTKESRGRGAGTRLYSIDLTGRNLKQIKTPREASDGCWSRQLS